jgi:cysteinyl-tRNA synthetase
MDRGQLRDGDRGIFLDLLDRWDRIFAVLEDSDHARLRQFGLIKERTDHVQVAVRTPVAAGGPEGGNGSSDTAVAGWLADQEIEKRIAEREVVRRKGDFTSADRIRVELLSAGVILEDTKVGTRWKRK